MKFDSTLDELEHWLHHLQLELYRDTDRRHVVVLARLCEVFAMKVSRDKYAPASHLERRMRLSLRWLDLQRQLSASAPSSPAPAPTNAQSAKQRLRVIDGGKNPRARASR